MGSEMCIRDSAEQCDAARLEFGMACGVIPVGHIDINAKGGGVIEALVRFPRPADVIQEFGDDVTTAAEILEVRLVKLPAIIIGAGDFGIGTIKEGDVLLEPRSIIAKISRGQTGLRQDVRAGLTRRGKPNAQA